MSPRQATLLTLLVVVGTVAVGLPAVTAQETTTETVATQTNSTDGMGTQLTAFLQSNSAAANDTVENGMWKAAYNQSNATERADLVTKRTGSLEQRLERLKARNATLEQRYENGSLSEQAYVAQRSRLVAEIEGLQTAINDTDARAEAAGVNDTALERLKNNASELSGQQVASVARGIAGPPADVGPNRSQRGPTEGVGPNESERGPADDVAPNDSERGPSDNGSAPGANQSGQGPPEDAPEQGTNESDTQPSENGTDGADSAGNSDGGADGQRETDDSDDSADGDENTGGDRGNGQANDAGKGQGNSGSSNTLWTRPLA